FSRDWSSDVCSSDLANQDGVTGFTVAPGDPHELAARLNQLLDDKALAGRMADAARQRALGVFTLEQMGDRTLAVYEEAVARHRQIGRASCRERVRER